MEVEVEGEVGGMEGREPWLGGLPASEVCCASSRLGGLGLVLVGSESSSTTMYL